MSQLKIRMFLATVLLNFTVTFAQSTALIDPVELKPIFGNCDGYDCSNKNIRAFIEREIEILNVHDLKSSAKCFVSFWVEKNGSVLDAEVVKSCGVETLDNMACSIVLKMQNWKPAEYQGKAMSMKVIIPFIFE